MRRGEKKRRGDRWERRGEGKKRKGKRKIDR